MPFEEDDRARNETAFANFCQDECDRQARLFLTRGSYEQVRPFRPTETLVIRVDVYRGLRGQGFVVLARELRDDGWWERAVSIGNEDNRSCEWRKSVDAIQS